MKTAINHRDNSLAKGHNRFIEKLGGSQMTIACDILSRIHNGESNFDSAYTKSTFPESHCIMSVDEARLFHDLTQDEKLTLATKSEKGWYHLNIWYRSFCWIPEFGEWFRTDCLRHPLQQWENYVIDFDNELKYKLCD